MYSVDVMDDASLSCARCDAVISADELGEGLAVRVDGDLVCSMCVDTLPGEAQVRINQMRAVRGLTVTTYQVVDNRLPKVQLYSFTNSANITGHRRKLVLDGFYEAPLLPLPQGHEAPAQPPEPVKIPRQAKAAPNHRNQIVAAVAGVLVLVVLAVTLSEKPTSRRADDKPQAIDGIAKTSALPNSAPAKPIKTRFDYSVDPARGFVEATQDRDCPETVRQAITQELVRKRAQQLDDAEIALNEKRLDDASNLANALILADDIAFRDLRTREQHLRTRLLNSRTLATVAPVVTTPIPPAAPRSSENPLPQLAVGSLRLAAEAATFPGTHLRIESGGNRQAITKWDRSIDAAQWKTTIPAAGNYRIEASVASVASVHTSVLVVEVAGQLVSAPTPSTNDGFAFQTVIIGVVTVQSPGEQVVRVRPRDRDSWRPINLAEVVLTPTTEAVTSTPVLTTPTTPAPSNKPSQVVGRFVRVELPRKEFLSLAEVEVFSAGVNIARRGIATQSSTAYSGEAKRAIDGGTNGEFNANSTTHTTGMENMPWWEVDLGSMQPIEAVTIWNRTDGKEAGDRLNGFVVLVLDASRREVTRIANTPTPKESVRIDLGGGVVRQGSALLWDQQFVPTGGKDAGRALPLNGSEFIPAGWPGGTNDFFRSAKGGTKKRQMLTLDLIGHDASDGGIVLLLHPMRLDRKQVTVTLSDTGGKSVVLPPVTFAANDWTLATFSTKGLALNPAALQQLTLEDDPSQGFIPEEGGFLLTRLATTSLREPSAADLQLRAASLVRDDNRTKHIPRLLEAVARFRKRPWKNATELNRLQVLSAPLFDQNWRNGAQTAMNALVPKPMTPLFGDLSFKDSWLENVPKEPRAALDPAQRHIVVLLTGGEELAIAPTAAQALDMFWKKRLEQLIGAGVIPVVVLGPNMQSGERREEAEKLWPALADLVAKRQLGIAVIDLRAVKTAPTGALVGADAILAGQLLADGLNEYFYALRRSGGVSGGVKP